MSFITWKMTGIGSEPTRVNRLYERAKEYLDQRLDVMNLVKAMAQIKFVSDQMGVNDDLFEPEELSVSQQKMQKNPMVGDLESIKEE